MCGPVSFKLLRGAFVDHRPISIGKRSPRVRVSRRVIRLIKVRSQSVLVKTATTTIEKATSFDHVGCRIVVRWKEFSLYPRKHEV